MKYILASHSPRRIEYLAHIVPQFDAVDSHADETLTNHFSEREIADMRKNCVEKIPMFLSKLKCYGVGSFGDNIVVIGADTIVYLDGEIIGKPKDLEDAKATLRKLSGRTHAVYTGFTVRRGDRAITDFARSLVTFNVLSEELINTYVETVKPLDKAGAYGIQDGYPLVERCEGETDNVLGFPTKAIKQAISKIEE